MWNSFLSTHVTLADVPDADKDDCNLPAAIRHFQHRWLRPTKRRFRREQKNLILQDGKEFPALSVLYAKNHFRLVFSDHAILFNIAYLPYFLQTNSKVNELIIGWVLACPPNEGVMSKLYVLKVRRPQHRKESHRINSAGLSAINVLCIHSGWSWQWKSKTRSSGKTTWLGWP